MKRFLPRLTYANVVSTICLFLLLGGASAFAASQLGKNSVGAKQLKKNAVTAAKIKNNAVTGAKIKNGSISGAEVNLGSLGTVPSAATASNVTGRTPFFVRLNAGGVQTLATNGAVSLVATCTTEGSSTYGRILAQTTVNGAVSNGEDDLTGNTPTTFLNVTTPASEREVDEESESGGKTYVRANENGGFVLGPEGKMLSISTDSVAMGINYITPGCLFGGVIDAEG